MNPLFEILKGLLSTVYKFDDGKITELLKDGTEDIDAAAVLKAITDADKTRVQGFSGKLNEGYNKGKKEALEALEAEVKKEYGADDSDLKGIDLIKQVLADQLAAAGKGSDQTEDQIKRSKTFQDAERNWKQQLKDAQKASDEKVAALEAAAKKGQTFSAVKARVDAALPGMNPVIPKTAEVAQTQRANFEADLMGYDYEIQGDNIIPMKDGKVLDDGHGNTLDFDKFVSGIVKRHYEITANNGGGNSGSSNDDDKQKGGGTGKQYPAGITKPKTLEELAKITNDPSVKPEDKRVVMDTYEAEFGKK